MGIRTAIAVSLLGALAAWAQEGPAPWDVATPPGHFLRVQDFEISRFLPSPPALGSLAEVADLEVVAQTQAWRSSEAEAWARAVDRDSVWKFDTVLGSWFAAERLPRTARFFWELTVDVHAISEAAKVLHARPRPPKRDARLNPCVPLPPNDSYPSGHSLQAFVRAGVLAEIFPEHREALLARAHRAAWARILGGVHYPTDDVAGRLLAEATLQRLKTQERFRQAVAVCRSEADGIQREEKRITAENTEK